MWKMYLGKDASWWISRAHSRLEAAPIRAPHPAWYCGQLDDQNISISTEYLCIRHVPYDVTIVSKDAIESHGEPDETVSEGGSSFKSSTWPNTMRYSSRARIKLVRLLSGDLWRTPLGLARMTDLLWDTWYRQGTGPTSSLGSRVALPSPALKAMRQSHLEKLLQGLYKGELEVFW